jgi:hypothetical protein
MLKRKIAEDYFYPFSISPFLLSVIKNAEWGLCRQKNCNNKELPETYGARSFCQLTICPSCHFVNWPFAHLAILSTDYFVNLPLHQRTICPTCHFVNLSFCQLVILSTCHFVKCHFVKCHFVKCHFVNLPFCQFAIFSTIHLTGF